MNRHRLLSWILCLCGATEMLAFFAVVMPRSWMEVTHQWLGMGEMVRGPLIMFMIRQASFTYGLHGLSLCILATDVERFRPLIVFTGISFVVAALVFFLIDYTSGMPSWWALGDPVGCGLFGVLVLLLSRRS